MPPFSPALSALISQVPREVNSNILTGMDSPANMDSYSSIFDGPSGGHVPSAWEQYSGDRNADAAETAMGAGPAVDALRRAFNEKQLQDRASVQSKLSNDQLVEDDFNANGLNRGLAHADVQNQVGDSLSEARARRQFLPWGQQAGEQNDQQRLAELYAHFVQPAQTKAQGDIGAATINAGGRIGAAQASTGSPIEALQKALLELVGQGKSPEELQTLLPKLKQVYGVQ